MDLSWTVDSPLPPPPPLINPQVIGPPTCKQKNTSHFKPPPNALKRIRFIMTFWPLGFKSSKCKTNLFWVWKGILGIWPKYGAGYGIWLLLVKQDSPKFGQKDAGLGKIFGTAMTEVRDAGFWWKRSGKHGIRAPLPGPICSALLSLDLKRFSYFGY